MSFMSWIKNVFSKLIASFNAFIKEAFNDEMKMLIAEFKDFAIETIIELSKTDLKSEEKKIAAFNKIKAEAIKRATNLPDSLINILIELAVSRLKATQAVIPPVL